MQRNGQGLKLSVNASLQNFKQKCLRNIGPMFRDGGIFVTLQQMTFLSEQEEERLPCFQGGSRASRTALQESAKRLVMSVIYGRKCGVLLAKLSRNGFWLKMCQGFSQAKMEGFSEELLETFPRWGMMLDGELRALPELEPYTNEREWRLLPTPVACDYKGGCLRKNTKKQMSNLKEFIYTFSDQQQKSIYPNPLFLENLMGYPTGWTELKH